MKRKVIGVKDGFILTWAVGVKNKADHPWWHIFYIVYQKILIQQMIKTCTYNKSRIWITTCKKCDYLKAEAREVWIPGELKLDAEGNCQAGDTNELKKTIDKMVISK